VYLPANEAGLVLQKTARISGSKKSKAGGTQMLEAKL